MARVLFLERIEIEKLGPMYLSAALKQAGHEVELLIQERFQDEWIQRWNPDLLAFSVTTGSHLWALQRATELKERFNRPVIMGGSHATYFPEVIKHPALDAICRGEGEEAVVEAADRLDARESWEGIRNLWVKLDGRIQRNPFRPLVQDLDRLPMPDRDLFYSRSEFLRTHPTKNAITGRGCPYSCAYCSIAGLRKMLSGCGRFVRFRSTDNVVAELTELKRSHPVRTISFQDDTFILRPRRLETLLPRLRREVNLPYICHVRADLMTDSVGALLKATGCHAVDFGLESGDQANRDELLTKEIDDHHILESARVLHRFHLPFRTTNMLGLPGETEEQAWRTVEFNSRIRTPYPSSSVYQPYPRTELGDRAIQMGLVPRDYDVDSIGSSFYRRSVFTSRETRFFQNLQKFFYPAVRWPRLRPLIRRICRLPTTRLHDLIFLSWYSWNYLRNENLSLPFLFRLARRTLSGYFFAR